LLTVDGFIGEIMKWLQTELELPAFKRGFHLITPEVVSGLDMSEIKVGLLHVFIQHTSASLTLNENASPDVRKDFEEYVRRAVPDNAPYFEHTDEGSDDMSAHIKASLFGSSLSIPIRNGRLALGTWQGIYLCEHRAQGGRRSLVVTAFGE
jgi:secondary thiamine-phosphate synthase enzyme